MTTLYQWFDPSDKEHIKAFRVAQTTGRWPEGFVPDHVDMGSLWSVANKIADYYITKVIAEDEE